MERGKDLIVISGATGQQGGALIRSLLSAGHRVRAITRKPDAPAAQALRALGAEVVQGDLDDRASLARALAGAWGTFAVQNTWEAGVEKEEEQGKRYAEVARETSVQHYVYTSVASAHRKTGVPHFENKFRVETRVRELGFPSWVILRPVFFMENFLGPFFKPGLDQGTLAMAIKPATRLQMIAVADVGLFAKAAFERHADLAGQAFDLAGDEMTMPDAAKVIGAAAHRPVKFVQVPIAEVRKISEDYALMLEWFDAVGYDADIPGTARRFGVTPTRLADWAAGAAW